MPRKKKKTKGSKKKSRSKKLEKLRKLRTAASSPRSDAESSPRSDAEGKQPSEMKPSPFKRPASAIPAHPAKKGEKPSDEIREMMRFGKAETRRALFWKYGCAKCVWKPTCTASCWKQRKMAIPLPSEMGEDVD